MDFQRQRTLSRRGQDVVRRQYGGRKAFDNGIGVGGSLQCVQEVSETPQTGGREENCIKRTGGDLPVTLAHLGVTENLFEVPQGIELIHPELLN